MRHVTHMNAACHTYEFGLSRSQVPSKCVWDGDIVTRGNEPCHTYGGEMSHVWRNRFHIWIRHVTHMNAACHTHEFGLSRSLVPSACVWDSDLVTRMNEPCHTYEWVMTHLWKSHLTHMKESWHAYEWFMSHVTHMNDSCHAYEWSTSHRWMSHVTHMSEPCHKYATRPHVSSVCVWIRVIQ